MLVSEPRSGERSEQRWQLQQIVLIPVAVLERERERKHTTKRLDNTHSFIHIHKGVPTRQLRLPVMDFGIQMRLPLR